MTAGSPPAPRTPVRSGPAPADPARLIADARVRRRFAAAYRGDADPADALWWLAHPDDPGPTGALPPAAALAALRRRVYRRDPDPADVAELGRLLRAIERDRQAARDALAQALDTRPEPARGAEAPRSGLRRLHRAPRRLVLAAAGAVLLGALGGAALAGTPAPSTASPAAPAFTATATAHAGADVLARPARRSDRPLALTGSRLPAASFRLLTRYPADGVGIFAARDRQGELCLVAADVFYRASCVPVAVFRRDGIVLEWSSGGDWPGRVGTGHVAVWRPDGSVAVGREAAP